ncbi:MAG: Ig-like domain-containing protein [Chitinophagaceae bacterium]|nr:Ig-like domain-containing protein [Chitinophagaceae bacterium]
MKRILLIFGVIFSLWQMQGLLSGCAQISYPTGGVRDSLPPKLKSANPPSGTTNFKGKNIVLNFDEYIQLQDLQQNLLVAPTPKNNPYIDYKLRAVTIKLRDSLEPNTTYIINLGNSIRDINENNAINNYTYIFSTGPTIDSLNFSGTVQLAETGRADTTLMVYLYKNLSDSAIVTQRPKYISRLDGAGNFNFTNLSGGMYKVYALKDGDGSKTYNAKTELFAFSDSVVTVNEKTKPVNLFAYAEQKDLPVIRSSSEKLLKYTTVFQGKQDLLNPLVIEFNKPLKNLDPQKISITDTLLTVYKDAVVTLDSTKRKIFINKAWQENTDYKLIILKDVATDTNGISLLRSDTIRFKSKSENEYGNLKLNFPKNIDLKKNPVLQFVVNNEVVFSSPLTALVWNNKLFKPGDYEFRILYDDNKNGKWDPGNYQKKIQPEKVVSYPARLNVKADWENDIDIKL